jgi:hypothetical protein
MKEGGIELGILGLLEGLGGRGGFMKKAYNRMGSERGRGLINE